MYQVKKFYDVFGLLPFLESVSTLAHKGAVAIEVPALRALVPNGEKSVIARQCKTKIVLSTPYELELIDKMR